MRLLRLEEAHGHCYDSLWRRPARDRTNMESASACDTELPSVAVRTSCTSESFWKLEVPCESGPCALEAAESAVSAVFSRVASLARGPAGTCGGITTWRVMLCKREARAGHQGIISKCASSHAGFYERRAVPPS